MICFAWKGLPQYAARCIAAFSRESTEKVVVVATRPAVPIKGMDEIVPGGVIWVDNDGLASLPELFGEVPGTLIASGWSVPQFNRFRDEVRIAGGRVFAMSDGNVASCVATFLRAIRFRVFLRNKYDGFFVPGLAGRCLFRAFGVPREKVATGMYAADDALFHDGLPLTARPKRMVFVGRFHPVKNTMRMCEAFLRSGAVASGWTLDLFGCGELQGDLERFAQRCPSVRVHGFLQPDALAEVYREARVFILPSTTEPWGLVVHEAALSGCVLLLSDRVGAAMDLLSNKNGLSFSPRSVRAMTRAIRKAMQMQDEELLEAQRESVRMAHENVGVGCFVKGVSRLVYGDFKGGQGKAVHIVRC